nr:MAG TPA_asm: hypothetical protein [Caudoviricetes sp.]
MQGVNKYASEVRENKEIEFNGLTFFPLTVRDFPLYRSAAAAFELMQSSLPPKFARLSWCQCLDEMDKLGNGSAFLSPVLNVLAKALRLERIHLPSGDYGYQISTLRKDGSLIGIYIREHETVLTIQMMDEVRQLIAAQNDYQIPDENWNPELVAAEQYLANQNTPKLDVEVDAWVYSVAANVGRDADELWDWPIRKFKGFDKAIDRTLGYQIYKLAEAVGLTKFENGAPYPTWRFDRISELPAGFKTLTQLEAKAKGQLPEPISQK